MHGASETSQLYFLQDVFAVCKCEIEVSNRYEINIQCSRMNERFNEKSQDNVNVILSYI